MNSKMHALATAVLAELGKRVKALEKQHRGSIESLLDKGDRVSVRSPLDGSKIGTVSMTDPAPKARVSDQAALDGWVSERYPEKVVVSEDITDARAAVEVLRQHAPHLLAEVRYVPDWAVGEVLRASEQAGAPVGPGGEVEVPGVEVEPQPGRLQYRPGKEAAELVEQLVQAGMVSLVDGVVHDRIPGGGDQ